MLLSVQTSFSPLSDILLCGAWCALWSLIQAAAPGMVSQPGWFTSCSHALQFSEWPLGLQSADRLRTRDLAGTISPAIYPRSCSRHVQVAGLRYHFLGFFSLCLYGWTPRLPQTVFMPFYFGCFCCFPHKFLCSTADHAWLPVVLSYPAAPTSSILQIIFLNCLQTFFLPVLRCAPAGVQ